jgi:glycerophosphoryl diester phosphodiesterase
MVKLSEFLFIGHRGTRTNFDENTIEAFKIAIEFKANCIEFDVRMTKDEEIVIIHDPTLNRTTTGKGKLRDFKFEELINFKTKNHSQLIPKLSEVLKLLKGKTRFMIELKESDLVDSILKIVKDQNLLENCIFSGRNLQDLENIKTDNPNIKICYNITKGLGLTLKDYLKLGKKKKLESKPDFISLRSNLVSKEFIEVSHLNNIISLAWDFLSYSNPILQIKSLITEGIDGLLFDNHKNIPIIKGWIKFI